MIQYQHKLEVAGIFPRKPKVISEEDKDRFSRSSSLCSLIIKINAKRIMNTKTAKDISRPFLWLTVEKIGRETRNHQKSLVVVP